MDAHRINPARPWLTVIMPTYNGEATFREALQSISDQAANGVEVIVIDGSSTDRTVEIAESFRDRLNMRLISAPSSDSWIHKTNVGIAQASAEHVCFLHQDDLWSHGRLAVLKETLAAHPQAAMYFHPVWFVNREGRRLGRWRSPFGRRDRIVDAETMQRDLLIQNFICASSPVFRREDAAAVGFLDESLLYAADWDFWIKLSVRGPTVHIAQPLTCFRLHPKSLTATLAEKTDYMEGQLRNILARHLEHYRGTPRQQQAQARVASFSVRLNAALMRAYTGQKVHWLSLLGDFVALGPAGWHRFFRCSRIVDRVVVRLRAR